MKRLLICALLTGTLAGCEAARTIAPQTTAGFEAGGILGALDGASGALVARCRTLDGGNVRVAIDNVAAFLDQGILLSGIRDVRERACAAAALVQGVDLEAN